MPRGFVYKTYTADDGSLFQTRVDADQATVTARGWGAAIPGGPLIPRGLRERRAEGISPTTGRSGSARIGSPTATIWQGLTTTFTVEADDGTIDTLVVIRLRGERRTISH